MVINTISRNNTHIPTFIITPIFQCPIIVVGVVKMEDVFEPIEAIDAIRNYLDSGEYPEYLEEDVANVIDNLSVKYKLYGGV